MFLGVCAFLHIFSKKLRSHFLGGHFLSLFTTTEGRTSGEDLQKYRFSGKYVLHLCEKVEIGVGSKQAQIPSGWPQFPWFSGFFALFGPLFRGGSAHVEFLVHFCTYPKRGLFARYTRPGRNFPEYPEKHPKKVVKNIYQNRLFLYRTPLIPCEHFLSLC